jgi:hypothetical protein
MPSLPTRIGRALTGLLAIWCLGCTSYDVLLERLLRGPDAGQSCIMSDETPPNAPGGTSTVQAAADDLRISSVGCGCSHCVAVEASSPPLALDPQLVPEGAERVVGTALTVDRKPLVPPPLG